jgi:hypothetical protein
MSIIKDYIFLQVTTNRGGFLVSSNLKLILLLCNRDGLYILAQFKFKSKTTSKEKLKSTKSLIIMQ